MFRISKFALLAPVVLLLLLKVEGASVENGIDVVSGNITTSAPSTAKSSPTIIHSNVSTTHPSTTHPSTMTTSHTYVAPHFSGMLKRLVYVTLVFSVIIGFYFLVKFCRSGRRKARKYGVVKTPGDMEMRPLESDDDDDEDVTMFNRKD